MTEVRAVAFFLAFLGTVSAYASTAKPEQKGARVDCAVIEKWDGETELLDPGLEDVLEIRPNAGIPCGGWVSVDSGWAVLRHRDGFRVHASAGTFLKVTDTDSFRGSEGTREKVEQWVLYRGQIFAVSTPGAGELRVLTPNARVKMAEGRMIVVYSEREEETQLVALEKESTLENRFETTQRTLARPGEATSLNFRALRISPSVANAITLTSLKKKLAELRVDERERAQAMHKAKERQERKFAVELKQPGRDARSPASAADHARYDRHPAHSADGRLRSHFVDKVLGGSSEGRKVLKKTARNKAADPTQELEKRHKQQEEAEKNRLLQELSTIRPD